MSSEKDAHAMNRQLDYLAVLEERLLATKKENFVHSVVGFGVFGGLGLLVFDSSEVALLTACCAVFIVLQTGRLMRTAFANEFDRALFAFSGDMDELRNGLKSRRQVRSIKTRQNYYYGDS